MEPSQLKEFTQQNLYYVIAVQVVIGLIIGLIPLIFSFRKGKKNLGYIALVVSIALSLLSPLLSLVAAAVFLFLVFRPASAK